MAGILEVHRVRMRHWQFARWGPEVPATRRF